MRRDYADRDLKLLWGLAAARCAFPDCRCVCVEKATGADDAAIIGIIAHIVAHGNRGPRGDPDFSKELRNKYENLILLCANHHAVVDRQENTYTVADLRRWKVEHEAWVRDSLAEEMPNVGFAELEIVTRAILSRAQAASEAFQTIPPQEKLEKNGLSNQVGSLLGMGMAIAYEVASFVKHLADLDPHFPERLKAGFVDKYVELRKSGLSGDALFFALLDFASQGRRSFVEKASGLAVLAYLFEKCEVFES